MGWNVLFCAGIVAMVFVGVDAFISRCVNGALKESYRLCQVRDGNEKEIGQHGVSEPRQERPAPPRYVTNIDRDYERRQLAKILLDKDLITRTIADWSRPMPKEYLNYPLILAGPSGVGKGRLVKALMKDYAKFFNKVSLWEF